MNLDQSAVDCGNGKFRADCNNCGNMKKWCAGDCRWDEENGKCVKGDSFTKIEHLIYLN